jgi:hypothetical protein
MSEIDTCQPQCRSKLTLHSLTPAHNPGLRTPSKHIVGVQSFSTARLQCASMAFLAEGCAQVLLVLVVLYSISYRVMMPESGDVRE